MAITTKTLITLVCSVIFIVSYVHCHTTTASAPGRSITGYAIDHVIEKKPEYCIRLRACASKGTGDYSLGCIVYCNNNQYAYAVCIAGERCCCYHPNEVSA
ncbi:PREDICTED: defensin-like protein 106 [Camelina sativa]|uniref:Defensin-like protein 106 n=1 Tax=Camelina sativa TaxID=90675 RepID=A0ABM0TRJ8_CAMSA|nr:PREDICTED: defensin-like protein 106 [Camelina sativa]